jgi:RND family efflux transporter MFP subunit
MKKVFPIICLVIACLLWGCKDKTKEAASTEARQAVRDVTVLPLSLSSVDDFYETSGTVKAQTISAVASRVTGTVTAVKVRVGDIVKAGDVLLTIDDRDVAQKVAAAEAGYREALKVQETADQARILGRITYDRYKGLYDEKVVSGQEMDQIETQKKVADLDHERAQEGVKRARAMLDEARIYHGFPRITAPIPGAVTGKTIESGSMVTPGMPLFTIENASHFKVEAFVDEKLAGKFKAGMSAEVTVDTAKDPLKAVLGEVSPAVDPASRTYLVKLYLSDPRLKTGLYARVRIPKGKKEALVIPRLAIVERGQLTGVFVVDDQSVITYRLIKTGRAADGGLEVLSGLVAGERIITEGVNKAVDGGLLRQ